MPSFLADFNHAMKNKLVDATVAEANLGGGGLDAAELLGLVVGEAVEGSLGDVVAGAGGVNGEDVDAVAVVLELPAGSALGRVPANTLHTADVGEGGDLALGGPAVAGDETVGAVGASDGGHEAVAVVIAGVVGDCGKLC